MNRRAVLVGVAALLFVAAGVLLAVNIAKEGQGSGTIQPEVRQMKSAARGARHKSP